jgi:hypothetical protein
LQRTTALRGLVRENTYYMIGSLFFAFTVFWAYVNFSQYFIIWNANMPEETFWYVLREKGTWDYVGKDVIIFGHFFLPFLMLLRIDFKLKLVTMLPLAAWAWLMHFVDLEFQIMPALHKDTILTGGLLVDAACVLFFAGVLMKVFIASLNRHPVYPLKDPRMAEALGVYVPPASDISIAPPERQMNSESCCQKTRVGAYVAGFLGTFLIVAALVHLMQFYTQAPPFRPRARRNA